VSKVNEEWTKPETVATLAYKDQDQDKPETVAKMAHTTQDEDKPDSGNIGMQGPGRRQTKHKNSTQKTKKMSP
jgi:hypothetical protein